MPPKIIFSGESICVPRMGEPITPITPMHVSEHDTMEIETLKNSQKEVMNLHQLNLKKQNKKIKEMRMALK
jgi:hypothetical protein